MNVTRAAWPSFNSFVVSVPLVMNVTRAAWPSFSSFVVSVPLVMNVTRAAGLALIHLLCQFLWL